MWKEGKATIKTHGYPAGTQLSSCVGLMGPNIVPGYYWKCFCFSKVTLKSLAGISSKHMGWWLQFRGNNPGFCLQHRENKYCLQTQLFLRLQQGDHRSKACLGNLVKPPF